MPTEESAIPTLSVTPPLLPSAFRGFRLDAAARGLAREYNRRLRPYGLSYVQYFVLLVVAARREARPSDIATDLSIDSPSLSGHLDRLAAASLLTRRADGGDRRVIRIDLTAEGRVLLERLEPVGMALAAIEPDIALGAAVHPADLTLQTAVDAQRALGTISEAVRSVVAAFARVERVSQATALPDVTSIAAQSVGAIDALGERLISSSRSRRGIITTLRATTLTASRSAVGLMLTRFAQLIEERSNGTIRIALELPSRGSGELQTIVDLRGGELAFAAISSPVVAHLVSDAQLVELPYLLDDDAHAQAFLAGPFCASILERLKPFGLEGVAFVGNGFRSVTTRNRALRDPRDLAGLRLRTQEAPINVHLAEALSAVAVPLPFPHLAAALEAGDVDAQENALANCAGLELWRYQRHLTLTRHAYTAHVVMANAHIVSDLGADARLVYDALRDAVTESRHGAAALEEALRDELTKHLTITELDARTRKRFVRATRLVHERVARALGADAVERALAASAASRPAAKPPRDKALSERASSEKAPR